MIEFIAVVVLLIVIWFFLKIRKKKSSNATPKNPLESAKPIQQEPKPADKIVSATESVTPPIASTLENIPTPSEPAQQSHHPVESEQQPFLAQASSHKVTVSSETSNKNLPQDSMLKRHYLTHLRAMIISLSPPRPTDSALSRHYDTQIAAKIEQCLNDDSAMEQLIFHYEHDKKTPARPVVKEPQPIIASSPKPETSDETAVLVEQINVSSLPEDSMLRRHYLTHLHAQAAANLPPRPTDSMLRRHYDTLLENAVKAD
ncbi:MAG: hypothetical protein LUO95_02205 [Methylococcaceae bacterium]|nr:hypothetical protein [Methylococcaceae bacterium]